MVGQLNGSFLSCALLGLLAPAFGFAVNGGEPQADTAHAAGIALRTEANVMVEFTLKAERAYTDPFNDLKLDVVFTDPLAKELRVPAFWVGGNVWRLRYASPVIGVHRFRSECSARQDGGLQGITGTVTVKPYRGKNPLFAHGPLRVAANRRYLEHADGIPFFWLGDTWWMGLCHRLHWPEEFKQLAEDRKDKGFNVIQIVAGLYPDMPPFDPRGANETGFPWETNYARIRPEYFDAADQRLEYLVQEGFIPCIVGAWGYFMPWMGVAKMNAHWRYLIGRYGAWPVVWCAAGEANLPWYLAKGFPYDDRKQVRDWTEVMRFVRETDPFHRPLTIHPTAIQRYTARHATDDPGLLDVDMLQTPHGRREAVPVTVNAVRSSYAAPRPKPVIDGEASYEMLNDNLPTEWTRRMFWLCLLNGAAGHTYGANGIWQCNRPEQPHGASPHGGSYGKIPWNEAMHLPGSRQVGWGKKLLQEYAWQDFQPHPEWAEFTPRAALSFQRCHWIWFPEGHPAQNAPAGRRYFRREFLLREARAVKTAALRVSADDQFAVWVNGNALGGSSGEPDAWKTPRQFSDLGALLKTGTNVLAVQAENTPVDGANPAGLISELEIRFADGEALELSSDASWVCASNQAPGWETTGCDVSTWSQAMVLGEYGIGPWGAVDGLDTSGVFGPQCAGIPETVRVIYVPESEPIVVRQLGARSYWTAIQFDPVTGEQRPLGKIQADADGMWTCPPPAGMQHDWVIVLTTQAAKAKSGQEHKGCNRFGLVVARLGDFWLRPGERWHIFPSLNLG